MNSDKVKDSENVNKEVDACKALTTDQAISHIVNTIDADVMVPHMFCYPGYTTFRSLFDLLDIPYLGTAAEIQGILEDKWMSRAIAVQDGCRMADAQLLKQN
jgi:D-alanine-D-alanine ligase